MVTDMESKATGFLLLIATLLSVSCLSCKKETEQRPAVEVPRPVEVITPPVVEETAPRAAEATIQAPATVVTPPAQQQPATVTTPPAQQPVTVATTAPVEVFNPTQVTREQYDSTMDEVKKFIDALNQIVASGNYAAWRAALSSEYFEEISSPERLQEISELPVMTARKIVLKTAEDYFRHVFIPSRANSRVDDIEFFGKERVKVFTVSVSRTGEERRERLYNLEKIGNTWKIIN